jgi:Tfp pilus assembly protein PilZ
MKSILLADNRSDLLATLEPILKHWGYRVLSTQKADQVATFLQESSPCLLIIGEKLFSDSKLALSPEMKLSIKSAGLPVIALKQDGAEATELTPSETLEVPVELFELFSFIQGQVEHHPRQNLRLRLKLPGMYSVDDDVFILADVLSLSMNGLFFRAATRAKKGDRVTVVFPLLGHGKEIEVKSTVLYTIQPETGNNYSQGFGASFDEITDDQKEHLQQYIREHFLNEVSASHNGVGSFAKEQLKG